MFTHNFSNASASASASASATPLSPLASSAQLQLQFPFDSPSESDFTNPVGFNAFNWGFNNENENSVLSNDANQHETNNNLSESPVNSNDESHWPLQPIDSASASASASASSASSNSSVAASGADSRLSKRQRNNISALAYRRRRKEYNDGLEQQLASQVAANRALREQTEFLKNLIAHEREKQLKTAESDKPANSVLTDVEQASTALFVLFSSFLLFSPSSVPDLANLSDSLAASRSAPALNYISNSVYKPLAQLFDVQVVQAALSGIASHFANQSMAANASAEIQQPNKRIKIE